MSSAYRRLGWMALVAVVALYGYWQGYRAFQNMHGNDFKHLYLGAVFLRRGFDPYVEVDFIRWADSYGFQTINPYVYPPTTGLVLSFLTAWNPTTAGRIWFFMNHAMLIASLVLCAWFFVGFRDPWLLALIALLAATSYPLRRTLTAGQLNCALLLLYCGICWAILKRREWLGGLLVGFGILFKLVPGIFVVYFLWKQRWRAAAWTALWFAAILGISIATAGWKTHVAFWPVMREMRYGRSVWQERLIAGKQNPFYRDPYNQSPNSLFHHLLAHDPVGAIKPWMEFPPEMKRVPKGFRWANWLTFYTSLTLVLLALWAIHGPSQPVEFKPAGQPPRESLEIALMVMLSLLLPSLMWDHYVVALFLPQIILLAKLAATKRWFSWQMAVLIGASALLAWPIRFDQPQFRHGIGLLAMSAKLYGVLILFGLLLYCLRTRDVENKLATNPPSDGQTA
jgi:hypothetical protein